ncbi:MAG: DUF6737 family protein [Cyanobacteria bacterium P01_A01_bin.40]
MKLESNSKSTNVWDYKPKWCQPWSIILTGIMIIAGSWLILHLVWLTIAISLPIIAWWVYFLILYPQAFADYIASLPVNSPDL